MAEQADDALLINVPSSTATNELQYELTIPLLRYLYDPNSTFICHEQTKKSRPSRDVKNGQTWHLTENLRHSSSRRHFDRPSDHPLFPAHQQINEFALANVLYI